MITSPPTPYTMPTRTSCHDQIRPRSVRGPLPRNRVMSIATPAASTVGTARATVSAVTETGLPRKANPISSDTPTNTASTTT